MFSIENLAVKVKDIPNNLCYIDDAKRTTLPLSEAGNFNGRLMWFPPYDIQLREDVSNKITSNRFYWKRWTSIRMIIQRELIYHLNY